MRLYIASDHAGYSLKEHLKKALEGEYKLADFGPENEENVDYPDFALKVAKQVAAENGAIGILVCGTGIGMAMAANKVRGIRAAVLYDEFSARAAKEHNDANVVCVGARTLDEKRAGKLVEVFLNSEFLGRKKEFERHARRIEKIAEIEGLL